MPLAYLFDEHLRGGGLWQAFQRHNAAGVDPVDVLRVGDPPDLPLGSTDPGILLWTEREGHILLTRDATTIPQHLATHLRTGRHSPGIFILRPGLTVRRAHSELVLIAYAGDPVGYQDRITFIP